MDYTQNQKVLLEKIFDETKSNQQILAKILEKNTNVNTSIYGLSTIEADTKNLLDKYQKFYNDLYLIEKHKYRFQIASAALFVLLTIFGISGYWIRREYIPWTASFLLLLLAAPVFVVVGLDTTYTFLSIDFCASIGNSIISGITPSENAGIGSYLSCPSKQTLRTTSTAIYQYIINFDYLYNETDFLINNSTLMKEKYSLGNDKRNNTHFEEIYISLSNDSYIENDDEKREEYEKKKESVLKYLSSLKVFNYILAGLLSMTSCYTAKNSINYIEEQYCALNHGYMFKNVIFDALSGLGFILISVGLNKLIITMRSHYSKSLRGKKEFNTDIIDEDDDD